MQIYKQISENSEIRISIVILTYNHAQFIYKALDSAWRNSINLKCEFIIYNDASSDNTHQIILDFISEKENIEIVYICSNKRRYGKTNDAFIYNDILNYVRGVYIAYCDGDDVWADGKLFKQYSYMATKKGVSMTFGPSKIINEKGECIGIRNRLHYKKEIKIRPVDLMLSGGGLFHTSNIMISSSSLIPLPSWFNEHYTGDYPLGLLASLCGNVVYLPNVWGKYRKLSTSMSHKHLNESSRYRAKRAIKIYRKNMLFFYHLGELGIVDKVLLKTAVSREIYRFGSRIAESGYLSLSIAKMIISRRKLNLKDQFRFFAKIITIMLNPSKYQHER